ncbi:hypothetical protein [Hyphococcus sp.]|uniref:hypothetical protein n=1 Tax=Hyphococcus sp. TaxID=2038636 RepID=UPI0035C6AB4F
MGRDISFLPGMADSPHLQRRCGKVRPARVSGSKKAGAFKPPAFESLRFWGALFVVNGVVDRLAGVGNVTTRAFDGFTGRKKQAESQ